MSAPVFEMILDASGGQSGVVHASPSREHLQDDWHASHQEGQLGVDVGQTKNEIVVVSAMAGADTKHIEVYVRGDLLTIRGSRQFPSIYKEMTDFFHKECYWGTFSRTIVLPVDVKSDLARAEYTNGLLIVRIPKELAHRAQIPVTIVEE